jgi:hypothetical protein
MPVISTPLAISGAPVMAMPSLASPDLVLQICLPVFMSSAITRASSVVRKILPS